MPLRPWELQERGWDIPGGHCWGLDEDGEPDWDAITPGGAGDRLFELVTALKQERRLTAKQACIPCGA